MRCLVVGGTGFLGGAIVDALISDEHSVSILSRGKMVADVTTEVEVIKADRYEDVTALEGHQFDWVFDTCAYTPASVQLLLRALRQSLTRYVLISSISAYGTFTEEGLSEEAPVPDASTEDFEKAASLPREDRASAFAYGDSYGPLKRACEKKAEELLGERATSLRVGLLVGAGDYTDRLTWWVRRLDEAIGKRTKVPVPAPLDRSVQMIDVRDAAAFALRCANDGLSGIWNVTSKPISFGAALLEIANVSGSKAVLVPVAEDIITKAQVMPWTDIPLLAPSIPEFRYFLEVGTEKAVSAGLVCRPLSDTIGPLLNWDRGRRGISLKCGMTQDQEALLLQTVRH
ncbi:NAD-dependent epimerase/dehydratase family protein [Rhodophyticola sp. CCM32]|uniref:NAD-dependent epimerase/dehydratase family protein n=1 Tax=Rhodophyticola sp. CCM32 TaxID=2916397 RepID=UPI00107EF656|nr:NAD-dependent epimerase/dehydratase family protein [Rhodophyticola sp. CCM32]QBY00922.1 NAD-dependent epimerase/dehydratase family protein [Rhodophyticola sp. CCM32]